MNYFFDVSIIVLKHFMIQIPSCEPAFRCLPVSLLRMRPSRNGLLGLVVTYIKKLTPALYDVKKLAIPTRNLHPKLDQAIESVNSRMFAIRDNRGEKSFSFYTN